jgi:hypothetical protein
VITRRRITIGIEIAVAVVLLWLIWNAFQGSFINPPVAEPCTVTPEPKPHGTIDRFWYLIAVPIALLTGRYISQRDRPSKEIEESMTAGQMTAPASSDSALLQSDSGYATRAETRLADHPADAAGAEGRGAANTQADGGARSNLIGWRRALRANIVQGAATSFTFVAVIALGYETYGVWRDNNPWPLTFFVRCLNEGTHAEPTSLPTFVVTLVIALVLGGWLWAREPAGRRA